MSSYEYEIAEQASTRSVVELVHSGSNGNGPVIETGTARKISQLEARQKDFVKGARFMQTHGPLISAADAKPKGDS